MRSRSVLLCSMLRQTVSAFTLGVGFALPAPPEVAAYPFYSTFAGTNGSGCTGTPTGANNATTPMDVSFSCLDARGNIYARARTYPGGVGVISDASTFSNLSIPYGARSSATFSDLLIFSRDDPNLPSTFNVSANFSIHGDALNAAIGSIFGGTASAQAAITIGFLGASHLTYNYRSDIGFSVASSGLVGPGVIGYGPGSAIVTTPVETGSIGAIPLTLTLSTTAISIYSHGSAIADFLVTVEFPIGIDVFNLPEGYTVNAGTYLVNNRFVRQDIEGDPNAVPEPPLMATLLLSGLLLSATKAWRRGGRAAAGRAIPAGPVA